MYRKNKVLALGIGIIVLCSTLLALLFINMAGHFNQPKKSTVLDEKGLGFTYGTLESQADYDNAYYHDSKDKR